MRYEIVDKPGEVMLSLRDELTFADREAFDRIIARTLESRARAVVVDLSGLDYMDSAGLGMLLTLRDRAERAGVDARLSRPRGEVRELLVLACFDTIFAIEG